MKENIKTLLLVSLLFISCITKNFAQKNSIERKLRFNSDWRFTLGDSPENSLPNLDDSSWRKLNLPHDWSIEGKSEKNNPSEGDGGFYPMGKGWYRKTFLVPNEWFGNRVSIYFEVFT